MPQTFPADGLGAPRPSGRVGWQAGAVFVVVGLLNLIGSWIPYPWRDEAATWSSTQRSLSQLGAMLTSVDAVHGTYYLLVRGWAVLFGTSVTSLRGLSVLGVAVAAALVTVLSHKLIPRVSPAFTGIVCGLLPALTWAATEARSYSWVAAMACAIVWAFLVAVEHGGWRRWSVYAVLLAVGTYLFLYVLLLGLALLVSLPWSPRTARWPAIGASLAGATLGTPVVILSIGQSVQVSWLAKFRPNLISAGLGPFWGSNGVALAVGGALTVAAIAAAAARWREPAHRQSIAILVGWLALPSLVLLAASLLKPLYVPRYVIASVPALALLLALLADWLPKWWLRILLSVALLTAAVPAWVAVRQPEAKPSPYRAVAALESRVEPGDAVYIVGRDVDALRWAFPQTAGRIRIIGQAERGWRDRVLSQPSTWVNELGPELRGVQRLWLFADRGVLGDSEAQFARRGFQAVERFTADDSYRTALVLLQRR